MNRKSFRSSAAGSLDLEGLEVDGKGPFIVVVQDVASGAVLRVFEADRKGLERTLSANRLSLPAGPSAGEASGEADSALEVVEVLADDSGKALLVRGFTRSEPNPAVWRSCFADNPARLELGWLFRLLELRRSADPRASYAARLMAEGVERVGRKIGEEATETVIAAVAPGRSETVRRSEVTAESADLLYHLLMLWLTCDVDPGEVGAELAARRQRSVWEQDD